MTDPSSFSNINEFITRQINFAWNINFSERKISGSANLLLSNVDKTCKTLSLDTRDLVIKDIFFTESKKKLNYNLHERHAVLGQKLTIDVPNEDLDVTILYETSSNSSALQWLNPAQTAGKIHPYVFSQGQAIHARSLYPCQDTPAAKFLYSAKVSVKKPLTPLMSAILKNVQDSNEDSVVYDYEQNVPIPSYLVALACGALEKRKIGPRSHIWSEKEFVDQSAFEFSETEKQLCALEKLLGPYVWGIYDILVLPPSFPYGGMENPCLTFVTPTLLAGDKSLSFTNIHEITHSWTGNLVTNSTWAHFWLNEGHTMFIQRKIEGFFTSGLPDRHFSAINGLKILEYEVKTVRRKDDPATLLVPDLSNGVDPDDLFGLVPYEKGCNLLFYLEELLGGPEVYDPFLRAYIDHFKYKSISTEDWKNFLYTYFHDQKDKLDSVDWETWFFKPGMPPNIINYDQSLAEVCQKLAQQWMTVTLEGVAKLTNESFKKLTVMQVVELFDLLLKEKPLEAFKIDAMRRLYKLNETKNSEIKFKWLRLCIRARDQSCVDDAIKMATEQGRMKFVRPLYRDLFQWDYSKNMAVDNFVKVRDTMHPTTATMVERDMKLNV